MRRRRSTLPPLTAEQRVKVEAAFNAGLTTTDRSVRSRLEELAKELQISTVRVKASCVLAEFNVRGLK